MTARGHQRKPAQGLEAEPINLLPLHFIAAALQDSAPLLNGGANAISPGGAREPQRHLPGPNGILLEGGEIATSP